MTKMQYFSCDIGIIIQNRTKTVDNYAYYKRFIVKKCNVKQYDFDN